MTTPVSTLARSLAARCWQLHTAAERGDGQAGRRLERLAGAGVRAGQCHADLVMGWHRHAGGRGACLDDCPEASDGVVWASSWEAWWPPGKPPIGLSSL